MVSFMLDPATIARFGALFDAGRSHCVEIVSLRLVKGNVFVAKIKGISSRSEAQRLTGVDLYLEREKLPEPGLEEFYYADLIGLAVEDKFSVRIGRVVDVMDYGGGDILKIELLDGEELLLPFTRKSVPLIDVAGGRLTIDPPSEETAENGPQEQSG